ncbi:MAG: hypothetical protein DRJ52_11115 [Thermoprotei archaeon]|nr:MAG: hypothetical protein DRJ52_11115 [Thermoprotei archaeon]RLE99206.1 MAG: hypothetical protein DRJ63_06015 [Thermoprotei archaeon]HDI75535.1 Gfo/Idh/MocA family oxidoreductase [Thermoprotei archaeon]
MKIKAAVIGVGIQGEEHVKAYKTYPLVDLVAIADINEKRLNQISSKYSIQGKYTDYREMIEREQLDVVSVVTPDFLHFEPVIYALKNDVNVIVEKPLATSIEEAEEMVNLAKSKKLMLFVDFANRWNPPFAIAKERISNGELGAPLYAYFRLSDTKYVPFKMLSWASKTSVVFFLMSHTADLACWIFDDRVSSVYAFASKKYLKSRGVDTYDYVVAVLEFSRGGKAVLESAWILPESLPSIVDFRAEILCEEGSIFIEDFSQGIEVASTKYSYPRYASGYLINRKYVGFTREAIHHAVECLIEKKEPIVTPDDALHNIKVLGSIVKSIEEGQKVPVL